jgi:hypothetical protein
METTSKGLELVLVKRTDPALLIRMKNHYSKPKGFVGRNICYAIDYNGTYYGHIVFGSATQHLPNRNNFFGITNRQLYKIINNLFYNISKVKGKYPKRNFTTFVLVEAMKLVKKHWKMKYGDDILGFETLIEQPRTGELYRRAGFVVIGQTKGYTCKRESGNGTDSWTGKRVWNTTELRPKLVLAKKV